MLTLTLCESNKGFLCIQSVDEDTGNLVDLCYLDGESCGGRSHTWEALEDVGEQDDADDSDAFWQAVDASLRWLLVHRGVKTAWETLLVAYRGQMTLRDCAQAFRRLRQEVPCEE